MAQGYNLALIEQVLVSKPFFGECLQLLGSLVQQQEREGRRGEEVPWEHNGCNTDVTGYMSWVYNRPACDF